MKKKNYLLLLSIVFMLLMASREKSVVVKPKVPTKTHELSATSRVALHLPN